MAILTNAAAREGRCPIYNLACLLRRTHALDLVPGVLLAAALMIGGFYVAGVLGDALFLLQGIDPAGKAAPISGAMVAILLGLGVRNVLGLPAFLESGVRFALRHALKAGIVLVGIKLSIGDVLSLGARGILAASVSIATGLLFVSWINRRLGLPARLGTLIACGTGICGVTAILSAAPAIEAEEKEVSYAVANITLFGLLAMLFYPWLAHATLPTAQQAGLFLGTAIHDTSQVVGAALAYSELYDAETALSVATVTKLTRNLFLAVVVPGAAIYYARRRAREEEEGNGSSNGRPAGAAGPSVLSLVPLFVLGFAAMAVLRSAGDATLHQSGQAFGLVDAASWKALTSSLGEEWGGHYLLGTAMAAAGLNTSFSVFRGAGLKPFIVGLAGALAVGAVGFSMALLLG